MSQTVAIAVSNLIFQSRIRAAVLDLGLTVVYADTPSTLEAAIAAAPALLVVDLQERNVEPLPAIAQAKAAGAAVLAFGPHTNAEALRAARSAGADLAVPRSRFKAELPDLLRSLTAIPANPTKP